MKHVIGNTYGELTYVGNNGYKRYPSGQRANIWVLRCSCGNTCEAPDRQVTSGIKQSCGHLKYSPRVQTHGGARGKSGTPEWRGWRAMRTRCLNPNDRYYANYGGRGIQVCERWLHSFENFLQDMGKKPTINHTLDRIDPDGNYCPENCRWATQLEQANNRTNTRMVTHNGETKSLGDWSRELGVKYFTLYSRLKRHGSIEP